EAVRFLFPYILTCPLQRGLRVTKGEACFNSGTVVPVVSAVSRIFSLDTLKNFTSKSSRQRKSRSSERDVITDTSVRDRHDVDAGPRVGFWFELVRSVVSHRSLVEPFLVALNGGSYGIDVKLLVCPAHQSLCFSVLRRIR